MKRSYETMVVYDGSLTEDDVRKEANGFEALLKEKCDVTKVDDWGRRKLAYEIKGRTAGYYVLFIYDAESGMPAEIDRRFKLDEKVLRYLTVIAGPSSAAQAEAPEEQPREKTAARPDEEAEEAEEQPAEKAPEEAPEEAEETGEEPRAAGQQGESDAETKEEDAESAQA